ncbi:MAG: hypothetical protein ABI678_02935 [Kofleriaceae bacterium]
MSRSWIVEALGAESFERLAAQMPGTELQSVLLEVMHRRAAARTPHEVLAQYRGDKFVRPAAIDLRTALEIDRTLLAEAVAFEAIELSPVAPLGTCSTMALTDQHRVLSALRRTAAMADPTNVLALECAERLREGGPIHLTTSHRALRTQPFPDRPGFAAHFRIFVLASTGREQSDHGFTTTTLVEHIRTIQRGLDRLEEQGYAFGARRVDVLARPDRTHVAERIAAEVGGSVKPLDHAYYSSGLRYMLWVTAKDGSEVPLCDGGAFDWVATLTSNPRNVYVATGMGAQLIAHAFRA